MPFVSSVSYYYNSPIPFPFYDLAVFGKKAEAKGAITGVPDKQAWIVWVHPYYEHPQHPPEEEGDGENVL